MIKRLFLVCIICSIAIISYALTQSSTKKEHAQSVVIYRNGKEIYKNDSVINIRCIGNSTIVLTVYPNKEEIFVAKDIKYKTKKSRFTYYKENDY